jgi:PAS domain S-box-containing protein
MVHQQQKPPDIIGRAMTPSPGTFEVNVRLAARPRRTSIPYRALLEHAPDATVVVDQQGLIILVNQQTERLFGYARGTLVGQPVEQLIPARFHAAHRRHRALYAVSPQTRPMGSDLPLLGRRHDGGEFPIEVSLSSLEATDATYLIASIRDVSKRQRLEAVHRELETVRTRIEWQAAELDNLFEGIVDGLVIYDAAGNVVRTNTEARRILGLDAAPPDYAQLPADERASLFVVCDEQNRPLRNEDWPLIRVLSGEVQVGIDARDVRMHTLDGREMEVNTSAAPLRDASGRLVGAVTILHDQTKERRLAREREAALLREQEAQVREEAALEVNQHMEQFLATASHDLRNPVTAALGSVQMAQRRVRELMTGADTAPENARLAPRNDGVVSDLERACQALHRLNRLIGRLFDLTQMQLGQMELMMEPLNLADLVRTAVEAQCTASPERTIHLHQQVASGEPVPVLADADRIDQVLTNYLSNAVKYAPSDQPIAVSLQVEAGQARVSVQDHGPGVPLEEQSTIWELHHRAAGITARSVRTGSLGLGLYLCKTLVERHGGQVGMESTPDLGGATFWFTLPLTPRAAGG